MGKYTTITRYVSGSIVGPTCGGAMAASSFTANLTRVRAELSYSSKHKPTVKEMVKHAMIDYSGDFTDPTLSADTSVVIERRFVISPGHYAVHIRKIPVSKFAPELVDERRNKFFEAFE